MPLDPAGEWRDGKSQLEGPRLEQLIGWLDTAKIDEASPWVKGF